MKYLRTRRSGYVYVTGSLRIVHDTLTTVPDEDADAIVTTAFRSGVVIEQFDVPATPPTPAPPPVITPVPSTTTTPPANLAAHVTDAHPHTAYDDIPSVAVLFENGLI